MGFFSSLGKKISSAAHSIGQKAKGVVKKGVKFTEEHAGQIANVAGEVSKVASGVSKVAGVIGSGAATYLFT